jgi:hypothetical protein
MKTSTSKSELAAKLEISASTLRKYIHEDWMEGLLERGYKQHQKRFTLLQIEYIKSVYGDWDFQSTKIDTNPQNSTANC